MTTQQAPDTLDMILLKEGEVVLKGLNKHVFEQRLTGNIRRRLKPYGKFTVTARQSIVYVEPQEPDCDIDGAFESMKKVFGIMTLTRAMACPKDPARIAERAKEYLYDQLSQAKTFKVESRRGDKGFPMTSVELSQYVGGELDDAFPNLTADMHHPELTVHLEVRDRAAYIHGTPVQGAGGLPVGSSGSAVSMLSGGIDSPVSTYMMAKRGMHIIPVHFFSFPYTSELAKEKVLDLAKILTGWCGRLTVEIVPFTHIQEEIRAKCPEDYFTIIMRRMMMRISNAIALDNHCGALITGESLGQVASQTVEAMAATEQCATLPVLRPLVGMDKAEVITIARHIGTFDTSILPYEDCCTVFT
ncbi:MAG: tRNA 4-thiouridine(8) synthase ThiI, partial [Oscillospiraceae bacterium]|nr:tRNA 4-thiouridine(8) synthase ThiI [Oscillospiraceae bacterium]